MQLHRDTRDYRLDGHYLKRESLKDRYRPLCEALRVFNNRAGLSLNFEILFLLSRAFCFLSLLPREVGRRSSFSTCVKRNMADDRLSSFLPGPKVALASDDVLSTSILLAREIMLM